MEKQITLSPKALYQELIYVLVHFFAVTLGLLIFLILIYIFFENIRELYRILTHELISFNFALFIWLWLSTLFFTIIFYLVRIIINKTNNYYFYSDKIVSEGSALNNIGSTIPYSDIKSVDLIEDDIISKHLGMSIVGIYVVERNILRGLETGDVDITTKKLSFGDTLKVLKWLSSQSSIGHYRQRANPMIRLKKIFSEKKYYQMFMPLPKEEARDLKNFLDQKLKNISVSENIFSSEKKQN